MSTPSDSQRMEKIVSLCKRRGFIFQSSEIYGGLNGCWDYGPLGVELKRNLKNYWWRVMVHERDDVVGMDGSILMNRAVWKASGHEDTFTDPMVDCRSCKARLRADQIVEKKGEKQCPVCGAKDLTEPRSFNLMFKTYVGATEDESSVTYLRPETAQAIFVQFKNVLDVSRKKLPFGIAQIGKAFRNEINPRNFTFRSREFEQMELEYFCWAEEGMKLLDDWKEGRLKFYENIGIAREKLHVLTVPDEERAFYSKGTYDIEYDFPFGRQELEGVAYRTDYDLSQHQKASGKSLEYFDEETKQKFIPHVVEPSAGVDRTVLARICEAYSEDQAPDKKGKMETQSKPFGPDVVVFKVGGKMFALASLDEVPTTVNLKCDPDLALELRDRYEQVRPGYHMNKKHWNTVEIESGIPEAELRKMIDHSYDLVVRSLPKSKRFVGR